jgi:hypothetical protein
MLKAFTLNSKKTQQLVLISGSALEKVKVSEVMKD